MTDTARLCPRCKNWTTERTSTNNAFCRQCDFIFDREGPLMLTQSQIHGLLTAETQARQQAERELAEWRNGTRWLTTTSPGPATSACGSALYPDPHSFTGDYRKEDE